MGKTVKFIVFSDLHYHNWRQHNEEGKRLNVAREVLSQVSKACTKYQVPALFAGDIAHDPEHIGNITLHHFVDAYLEHFEYPKIPFYAISGNHDQAMHNTYKNPSISYSQTFEKLFSTFTLLDYATVTVGDTLVAGIPYNNGDSDYEYWVPKLKKVGDRAKRIRRKILLLHTDLPGAKDPSGYTTKNISGLSKYTDMFKGYDLVLSGHIHKYQVLHPRIVSIGAPVQQRRSDMGCEMGYLKVYTDCTTELVPLELPQFKFIPLGRKTPPDTTHYWVPLPNEEEDISEGDRQELRNFKNNTDPKKMGKKYLKMKGIRDKVKRNALLKVL